MKNYYGLFPFWCWNGKIRSVELARQLLEFKRQNVNEVMMCPTAGMNLPYPSDAFFRKVRFACKQAAKLGMNVWLYDDYNWPSGVAAGQVFANNPDYRNRALRCYHKHVENRQAENIGLKFEDGDILSAWITGKDGRIDLVADLKSWPRRRIAEQAGYCRTSVPADLILREGTVHAPAGGADIHVCVVTASRVLLANVTGASWCCEKPGYVDTLNPKAIAEFIRLTHEQYARHVGRYFGNVIKGIFTDEPTITRMHWCDLGWTSVRDLPWTNDLPSRFSAESGIPFAQALPSLIPGVGEPNKAPETRRAFWKTVANMYFDAYHRQIRKWCDKHNLAYAGHVLSDKSPYGWIGAQGDYLDCMRLFHVPAMDHVWSTPKLEGKRDYGWTTYEFVTAKVISSVARQERLGRVCSETFALGGFASQMRDWKATTDFLAALGVNMFLISGAMYSLSGNSRRICPTLHSYQSPAWPQYRLFAEYVERLCKLMSKSGSAAEVGLLWPRSDWWTAPSNSSQAENFISIVRTLLRKHVDFEILHEDLLQTCRAQAGLARIRRNEFHTIIVPPVDDLSGDTETALRQIEKRNVHVLRLRGSGHFCELDALTPSVCLDLPAKVMDQILVSRRRLGKDMLFFMTYHGDRKATGEIILPGPGLPARFDFDKQNWETVRHSVSRAQTHIPVAVQPGFSIALKMSKSVPTGKGINLKPKWRRLLRLRGAWQFEPARHNAFLCERWQTRAGKVWKNADPARIYLDYPAAKGLRIRASFRAGFIPEDLFVAYERGVTTSFSLNGIPVNSREENCRYLDESTRQRRLAGIRKGWNVIEATFRLADWERRLAFYGNPTLPPFFLLGSFAVVENQLVPPPSRMRVGSWTEQGYPAFSGTAAYRKTIVDDRLTCGTGKKRIFLRGGVHGGVMTVYLNGRKAGTCSWDPYELEITQLLKSGPNELTIEVTNSIANLMEAPTPSGIEYAELGMHD